MIRTNKLRSLQNKVLQAKRVKLKSKHICNCEKTKERMGWLKRKTTAVANAIRPALT